ncbi:anti-sigma factor [Larkinella humicola]|uniref:Anti-sigma factor n=1 Tax=Larkinella humicola TaxID=2607654 RepID=A0A5N1JCF6_9BACT|nr:anti-sigma factor [Larkinella humicola]KAA9352687.1 anti-sigma factor [Larkinella humicola]
MSLSKEEQVNEEWRSIFEDAAESPSDELWDRIARRLDEEETEPIIPLWPRAKPWLYGVAAAVMALLIGWWAIQSIDMTNTNQPVAGQSGLSPRATADQLARQEKVTTPATTPSSADRQPEFAGKTDETLAANRRANTKNTPSGTPVVPELEHSETATTIDQMIKDQSVLTGKRKTASPEGLAAQKPKTVPSADHQPNADAIRIAENRRTNQPSKSSRGTETNSPDLTTGTFASSERITKTATPIQTSLPDETGSKVADTQLTYEASYIKSKLVALKNPAPISRIIWYRAPETTIEPQEKGRSKNEYWAALTATPMSFNPMTSVQSSFNQAYVASNAVQQSSRQAISPLQNQAQISMAWQASSGLQFSKHWSVEAGVQYLNGRSQARNNATVTNVFTNQTENLLVNAIRNSSPALPQLASSPNTNFLPSYADKNNLTNASSLVVVPSDQVVSNDFQYLQVPVQIGYHILPEHKISYSVLGGLMANVFLKNTVNGALEVNPSDQVYRPMSLAGTAGLRVSYHPTHHWSGSLTGSYQQSLQNGTQSDAQLQVRPQAVGVGFGLNYHF